MSPRLAKIWGDLKGSPARALLIALSVVIGTAALGTALGARAILEREIASGYAAAAPAAAVIGTGNVSRGLLEAARREPGVVEADARRLVRARVEVAPGDWRPLLLFAVRDFSDMRVSEVFHRSGSRAPGLGEVLVERSALPVLNVGEGGALRVRVPGGHQARLRVAGIVHDPAMAPGWQDNAGYAYTTPETLAALGLGAQLDELRVTVDGDRTEAAKVGQGLARLVAATGAPVERVEVPTREHPHADHMRTMLMLLTAFGALALGLSAALTANVFAALLARQTRQIGMMKAIGARSGQVAGVYAGLVAAISTPALLFGLPLGALGARAFSEFAAVQLNLEPASFNVPLGTLLVVLLVGGAVPAIAAAIPIRRAMQMTAREALADSGVRPPPAARTRLGFGDTRMTLAFRNTLRRPGRLTLTLIALGLGGAALMTGLNVYASLVGAVDRSLSQRADDLDVRLLRPVPADVLAVRAAALPSVERAEVWGGTLASVELPSSGRLGTERYGVLAPPSSGELLRAPVIEGRWPRQLGEVAVNRAILAREPALAVGRQAALLVGARRVPVRVVGLVEEVAEPHLYTTPPTYDTLIGRSGTAGAVRLVVAPGEETSVATALEEVAADLGSLPVFSMTKATLRTSMVDHFAILLALLTAASIAAVIVGGLGLAATMSLNVLERAREIGVMRAIGARRGAIQSLLLTEGAAIAGLSFVISVLLSLPLSMLVGYVVGQHGLHADLPFRIDPLGIFIWAGVVTVVTIVACLAPVRGTLRLPVREVLAYE